MANLADDIRRIAREKQNKSGLGNAKNKTAIAGSTKAMTDVEETNTNRIKAVSIEVFYPNTPAVTIGSDSWYNAESCTVTYEDNSVDEDVPITHTVLPPP